MLPVLVKQENRTEDSGSRRSLYDADQLAERLLKRTVADSKLEHPIVRVSKDFVPIVVGYVVALKKDAPIGKGLRDEVDQHFLRPAVEARDPQRESMSSEGFARPLGILHDALEPAVSWHDPINGFPDQISSPNESFKRLVGKGDARIRSFEQRHEAGRLLEHLLESLALDRLGGKLVEHPGSI